MDDRVVGGEVAASLHARPVKPPERRTTTCRTLPGTAGPVASAGAVADPGHHAHLGPGVVDRRPMVAGLVDGDRREAREVGARLGGAARQRGPPDTAGALPRGPADRRGREVEGPVGDAGVQVHAPVVVLGDDEVVEVADLGVPAEHRVVVRRAGRGHVAQGARLDPRHEQPGADQPVPLPGLLPEQPLLETGGEDIRDRLVEGARLVLVDQPRRVLGHGVRELVAQDVDGLGEPLEHAAVPVAEDQLRAVPEGVVVALPVVDGRDDGRAVAVVGRPAVGRRKIERGLDAVGRLVHGDVTDGRLAGDAHPSSRQRRAVLGGVHAPGRPGRGGDGRRPSRCRRAARTPRSSSSVSTAAGSWLVAAIRRSR